MMQDPGLRQNRLGWIGDDLRVAERSDTLFFVGCLPYYDALFRPLGFEGVKIAQAAVRILNRLGIEPQVLAGERCCGHDQLWQGDVGTFEALVRLNVEEIKASGARRIVTTCPECARTLKLDYPRVAGSQGWEVLHISEAVAAGRLEYAAEGEQTLTRITFQDPCRLGRHMGVYDAPRAALAGLGVELVEMERSRAAAVCCGTSCWASCGRVSKQIQGERLREAKATGAAMLVTACLKCQIHFLCAQDDPLLGEQLAIQVRDLTTVVADRLAPSPPGEGGRRARVG
jgi:Fe-S oxidoreductase